jgi:hypothetical protein
LPFIALDMRCVEINPRLKYALTCPDTAGEISTSFEMTGGQRGHCLQMVRCPFERHDLVAKFPIAGFLRDKSCIRILPVEFLYRKVIGRLPRFDGVALEYSVAGEWLLLVLVVDAVDGETHASDRLFAVTPGDGDDVVVREGDGVLHDVPFVGGRDSLRTRRMVPGSPKA